MLTIDHRDVAAGVDQLVALLPRLLPRESLSLVAAATLATLEREGPTRLTALAELAAVSQPGMTGLIGRLHVQGLVERAPDPDDRRSVRVSVTAAGRELLAERRRDRAEKLAGLIAELDDDDQVALAAAVPAITRLVARSGATGASS